MTRAFHILLLVPFFLFPVGCSIDFNEAVPCASTDHCPEGMSCDPATSRCVVGAVSDVTNDTRVRDLGRDLGSQDIPVTDSSDTTASDVTEETTEDTTTDTTTDGDTTTTTDTTTDTGPCVPQSETCNGLDEDCDDVPDNGLDCGSCPTGFGDMVLIVREGGVAFCIDKYEASREDATIDSVGTSPNFIAHSQLGVLPWSNPDMLGARTACETGAGGKRLCTVAEWQTACAGAQSFIYPYSADTYNGTACNGADAGEGRAAATGAWLLCESPEGVFDLSGNLSEWVEGGTAMGGSFGADENVLRCDQLGQEPDLNSPGPTVGYRCCADAIPPE